MVLLQHERHLVPQQLDGIVRGGMALGRRSVRVSRRRQVPGRRRIGIGAKIQHNDRAMLLRNLVGPVLPIATATAPAGTTTRPSATSTRIRLGLGRCLCPCSASAMMTMTPSTPKQMSHPIGGGNRFQQGPLQRRPVPLVTAVDLFEGVPLHGVGQVRPLSRPAGEEPPQEGAGPESPRRQEGGD